MKFIYFDVGNVFMTFDKIFTTVCKDFNLDQYQFDEAYGPYDIDANLGKINIPDVWPKLCQQLDIKNGQDYEFIKSWVSDYESILPMHQFAKSLENKFPLGIISNYYNDFFQEATRQNFIPNINFSHVIISAEVGCAKPFPEIYRLAEEKCGYKGSDIFFIDDKQENIDEATRHGWQTFLFDYHHPAESVDNLKAILL